MSNFIDQQIKNVKDATEAWNALPDGNKLKEATRHEYERFANKLKDEL